MRQDEYRIALTEDQNDLPTELAYADSHYHMRRTTGHQALNTATSCFFLLIPRFTHTREILPSKESGTRRP